MFREELQLPRQLLDVEGDAVGDEPGRRELRAPTLKRVDKTHSLTVQSGVLCGRRRTEMRLQRHVAQILQRDDAELVRVTKNARDRYRHQAEEVGDVDKRKRVEINRARVDGKHLRRFVATQDSVVPAV